jgi:hypothetical protein
MSAQPAPNKKEEYARYRRQDHANIEAMQNYIITSIAAERNALEPTPKPGEKPKTFEMPPNVRHLISALQGSHGGGKKTFEEFERGYQAIGRQLQFTGTEEAIRSRVRSWLDALDEWQYAVGYRLFTIIPGGTIVGERDDHTPIYSLTKFIDHLKPVADDHIQLAKNTDLWKGTLTVKSHPGRAMEAQSIAALKDLPRLGTRAESGAEKTTIAGLPPGYEKQQAGKVAEVLKARTDKIAAAGGDSAEWVKSVLLAAIEEEADRLEMKGRDADLYLEHIEIEINRIRASRRKTAPARLDHASLSIFDDDAQVETANLNATTNTCKTDDGESPDDDEPPEGGRGKENLTPPPAEVSSIQQHRESKIMDSAPNMLDWALLWASRGIPVFPLHEVYDDICTCICTDHWRKKEGRWITKCEGDNHVCGSECANKGKHPRTDRQLGMRNGLKVATTDPATIKAWWGAYPTANIGGRMQGKVGIDVDPRHGGDASLYDLCQEYGQEWVDEAWRNKSGSGGPHLIFDNSTGVIFKNSAGLLGPGLDTRGDDGYLVMPPSLHASGNRYEVEAPAEFPPLPQFIIDLLNKPKSENQIAYQDRARDSTSASWGEKFLDGHRNDGLVNYAIGRMRHAWEQTEEEFYQQLSHVNQARCVPPLDDDEVRDIAAHIAYDYRHLYGVNVAKSEAA